MKMISAYKSVRDILRKTSLIPWILIIVGVWAYYMNFKKTTNDSNKIQEQHNTINALADTVKTVVNEDQSKTASITAFETQREKDFLTIQSQQEEIVALQNLVRKYKSKLDEGSSATRFTSETKVNSGSKTTSILVDSFPEYHSNINLDNWIVGKSRATKDSTYLSLSLRNEYDVIVGAERYGFLNTKRKPFVDVTTHNPYSEVKTLRTYRVKVPDPKRMGLGVHIGYGFQLERQLKWYPVISVGLNFNLIEF